MRKFAPLFAAASLIAAIVAVFLWLELRAERDAAAQLRQRVAQLESGVRDLVPRRAESFITQSASPPQAASLPPVAPMAGAGDELVGPPTCDRQSARLRESLQRSQSELVTALSLSPAESDALVELAVSQVNLGPNCGEAGRQPVSQEEYLAELQRLLGPDRFEAYEEYRATQLNRSNMATLRSQLANTNLPLTAEQERRLDEIIVQEQRRSRALQAGRAPPTDPRARLKYEEDALALTEERFGRVLSAAQGHLDARQLEVLKANMDRQSAMQRSAIAARRAHIEAGGDPARSPAPVLVLAP